MEAFNKYINIINNLDSVYLLLKGFIIVSINIASRKIMILIF